jgi:CheY-like chemotaxis protein
MSKIEEGRTTLSEDRVNFNVLLDWIYQMMQLKASAKGLALTFDLASDLPCIIYTDEGKLRQVLINLISNAIKFTQTGGVTLKVSAKYPEPEINVENNHISDSNDQTIAPFQAEQSSSPCWITFHISDTGAGIDPNEIGTIFEPFVQAEAGLNAQGGTGLGLPICQEFVHLMGGSDISVESQVGEGATFRFSLPFQSIPQEVTPETIPYQQIIGLEPGQRLYRILVVDDQQDSRRFLVDLLTPLGFQIQEASNGEAAITLWQSWWPDLIWMDMNMPTLDGCEAARQIRLSEVRSPVILGLTGSHLEEEKRATFSQYCDDWILKPIRAEVVFEKMAQYLGVRYRYRITHPMREMTATPSDQVTLLEGSEVAEAIATLPTAWIQELHDAALRVNAKQSLELIERIGQQDSLLRLTLVHWVEQYRFEDLVEITQKV